MKDYLTIGEVAKITNLSISTLRYYDSEGIISPSYKDENTNYRYYRFFQIPIIKMIVHLKKLGFNNSSIKSHLENLSYSHTLNLMNQMIEQTRTEILRLQNLERDLEENAIQMRHLVELEKEIDTLFVEEEEIEGIYAKIDETDNENSISKAFKELDSFLSSLKDNFFPIGMCAFTMRKEKLEKREYVYNRLLILKDFEGYEKKIKYPRQKYVSLVCQSSFEEIGDKIDRVREWLDIKNYKIAGDAIIHIASGPAFEKNPAHVMYILKVPIKE